MQKVVQMFLIIKSPLAVLKNIFFLIFLIILFLQDLKSQENKNARDSKPLQLVESKIYSASTKPGLRIKAQTFYSKTDGIDLISFRSEQSKGDSLDSVTKSFSKDNGANWSKPKKMKMYENTKHGSMRKFIWPGWVDPKENILISFSMKATTASDHPLERIVAWSLSYSLSRDGGRSSYFKKNIIQKGKEFNVKHPFPNVFLGRSAAMIGDTTVVPIKVKNGSILLPIQVSLLDSKGKPYNPGGGHTYHDTAKITQL